MKKLSAGRIFVLLSILATAAGLIIYCINANGAYYHDFTYQTPLFAAICLAIEVLILLFASGRNGLPTDLFYPAGAVLLAVTAVIYTAARVESAGIILGSDLESGNALASGSLNLAFAGIGCFVGAMLILGIAGMIPAKEK